MKNILTRLFLAIALVIPVFAVADIAPVSAAASQSVHIVKYAADQTTILQEQTVTYQWMEANLPVQGDGLTHYYTQGPTFEPTNLWDPAETLNLKDKGALKGTNLKDLCNLVGGMGLNDTVSVRASDGYGNDIFPYANVYTPDPRQGNMTICWYNGAIIDENGNPVTPGYVNTTYANGMLLAFFSQTTNADGKYVFGHQDMKDCFPPYDYHWYTDGAIQYPSTNGAYYKWVSEVKIYTDGQINWGLLTNGARTETVNKSHFENCIACHTGNGTFPMRRDLPGPRRRSVLVSKSVGFNPGVKGIRRRRSLRGNTVSADIVQINLKISAHGSKPLEDAFKSKTDQTSPAAAPAKK